MPSPRRRGPFGIHPPGQLPPVTQWSISVIIFARDAFGYATVLLDRDSDFLDELLRAAKGALDPDHLRLAAAASIGERASGG